MARKFFIGVDISKLTLDVAVLSNKTIIFQTKISNTELAVKELLVKLRADFKSTGKNTVYCAEHMGIFATFLLRILVRKKIPVCLESPLRIKLSQGIQRGKNDALDAIRIAQYAYRNFSALHFWKPPRPEIEQLQMLSSLRKRLIKAKLILRNTKKTEAYYLSPKQYKSFSEYSISSISTIKSDIKTIEQKMEQIIQSDTQLNNLSRIMTSIPCVGTIISIQIIIATNEFKNISCPKKFASYCGIAPFAKISGESLKGKPKVSHIANKELKSLLHLAAVGYVRQKDTMLGKYYLRKVADGKNKMSILNAIRNKIVHRLFACIRDNKLYTDD